MPDRARKGAIPTSSGDRPPDRGGGGDAAHETSRCSGGRAEVGAPPTISTALIRGYLARKREALEAFAAEARALGCEVTITDLLHVDGPDDPARTQIDRHLPPPPTGVRIETTPDEVAELHRLLMWASAHPTDGDRPTGVGALCRIPPDLAPVAARWQACLDRWIGDHEPGGGDDGQT